MGCYKAAVQVLKDADDLKVKVTQKRDWLNESTAWTDQQKLQTIYHQVLILDLEYALDKKVELELWNVGFKHHISNLQELVRDKKNPQRSELQALLTWALEAASGFYLTLLHEICNTFDLDLPFRKRGNVYGQTSITNVEQVNVPQLNSCLYICQYCLVHLGDIARYRNQRKQAENFYRQAILVSPTSGHPYNQLAILQASQGDKLSTVFYYIRATAVKNPFPASKTNLLSVLSAAIEKESFSEKSPTKMTVPEFIQVFLKTHGYLHTVTDLNIAETLIKTLNSFMTALVAVQSFTKEELIKITVINLYTLKHLGNRNELTDDENKVRNLVLELTAGSLSAMLMPVHTLKMDETLLDYYALPSIILLMYFIKNEPSVLKERIFSERLQIWPALCKVINNNQKFLIGFNSNRYSKIPLSEEKNLQGFLPLAKNFKDLNFKDELEDNKIEKLIRAKKMLDFTIWLSDNETNDLKLVTRIENTGMNQFEAATSQPDPTNDLLEEMRTFNMFDAADTNNPQKKGSEKKGGILKPQGSLEKSRESREVLAESSSNDSVNNKNSAEIIKIKRSKQNVALQSIYKKMEESNKQVKFNVDTEKSVKFEPASKQPQIPTQPQNSLLPSRTQSFNQNHPAFPVPPPQNPQPKTDYLSNLRNISSKENHLLPQFQSHPSRGFQQFAQKNPQFPQNYPPQSTVQQPRPHFPPPPPQHFVQNQFPQQPQNNQLFPQFSQDSQFTKNNPQFLPSNPQFWNREQDNSNSSNNTNNSSNNWWPQSFIGRSENPYSSSMFPQPPPQNTNFMPPNALKLPPTPQNSSNAPYDMFGASPWSNLTQNRGRSMYGSEESNSEAMSIRQAMLKEATLQGVPHGGGARPPQQDKTYPPNQGYSLFSSSWTPNLAGPLSTAAGQLGNYSEGNVPQAPPQHSLFGGHAPTSLAQLLEHQQQQGQGKKDDT